MKWLINYSPLLLTFAVKTFTKMVENIFSSIKPFFVVSKFFGFFLFSLNERFLKFGELQTFCCDIMKTSVAIFFACLTFVGVLFEVWINRKLDFIRKQVWGLILAASLPMLLAQFIFQIRKRHKIGRFLNKLNESDLKLKKLGIKIDFQRHRKIVKILSFLLIILIPIWYCSILVLGYFIGEVYSYDDMVTVVLYAYYLIYESLSCLQFIVPSFLVYERFKLLKKFVEIKGNFSSNLKISTEIFHDLADGISNINAIFSPHLISALLSMMTSDIFALFSIIYFAMQYKKETSEVFIIENLSFVSAHFLLKCAISHFGHSVTLHGEKIKSTIAKSIDKAPEEKKGQYLNALTQFNARNLKLQNIFFVIDWRVVLSVS